MDKEKFAPFSQQPGTSSWLEMQNFIGELMASSASGSSQLLKYPHQQSLRSPWETMRPEAPVAKVSHPGHSSTTSLSQGKAMPGFQRRVESGNCDEQQVRSHTCTCPGCPLSSLSVTPSLHSLTARPGSSSQSQQTSAPESIPPSQSKEPNSVPVNLSQCLGLGLSLEGGSTEPNSTSNAESNHPQQEDKGTSTHSPTFHSNSSHQICPPPVQAFPCLCCHRSFQSCAHLLRHQQGHESDFAHANSHHHFHHHHHHCPLASCLPCPHLQRSESRSPPPFPCLSCQRTFPTCAQLLRHQQGHAQQDGLQREHPCMHCAASFARPSQLLQHQRVEHASKASGFLCAECGRAFNSHSNLRIHLNVHTGARPYECADCGKSFSQSGALKIHRRIHTGERPYACAYCGRGFPHLAGVRAHQRIHTGEKPYRCAQCGKCFTQSGALKIHMRIHTGERPFICGLCGKGFSNRSGVRFHQRAAHGIMVEPNSVGRPSLAGAPSSGGSSGLLQTQSGHPTPGDSPAQNVARPVEDPQSEKEKRVLPYACEDCGRRFQDAPSRNRHQALEHYSTEEGEETRNAEPAKAQT